MITRRTALAGGAAAIAAASLPVVAQAKEYFYPEPSRISSYNYGVLHGHTSQCHVYRNTTNIVTPSYAQDFEKCYGMKWSELNKEMVDALVKDHGFEEYKDVVYYCKIIKTPNGKLVVTMKFDIYPAWREVLANGKIPTHSFDIRRKRS